MNKFIGTFDIVILHINKRNFVIHLLSKVGALASRDIIMTLFIQEDSKTCSNISTGQ